MLSGEQWFWKSRCWIGGRRDDGFCHLIGRIPPGSYQWTGFRRGTFAHRHAIVTTEEDSKYVPLNHLSDKQAPFSVYNSLLSNTECSVSNLDMRMQPEESTIWEAQFGDFGNGAQIIFDQFISSAETKWHRMNGLVVLLPWI